MSRMSLRARIEALAEKWEFAAEANARGDWGPDLVMASDAARVCAARLRQALGQRADDPEAFTTVVTTRTEWGVRRTWGDIGSVAEMDRRTAEKCAREWPGELVRRVVTAGEWTTATPPTTRTDEESQR